jgi:hypothetical protein
MKSKNSTHRKLCVCVQDGSDIVYLNISPSNIFASARDLNECVCNALFIYNSMEILLAEVMEPPSLAFMHAYKKRISLLF